MPDDQKPNDEGLVHYEGGIPVFDTRLSKLEKDAREAKDRDEEYKSEQLVLNRRLVLFTGVLAAVGLIGGAIGIYQAGVAKLNADAARDNAAAAKGMVEEMKKSGSDTHDVAVAAREQAKAAQASANAANRAIDATIESDRPWIASNGITTQGSALEEIRVTAHFINAGRSPARLIDAKFATHIYAKFPREPQYPPPSTPPSRLLLIPGRQVSSQELIPSLKPGDIQDITSGSKTLYFYGVVRYEDVRTREMHATNFCWFYSSKDSVSVCAVYNDAE